MNACSKFQDSDSPLKGDSNSEPFQTTVNEEEEEEETWSLQVAALQNSLLNGRLPRLARTTVSKLMFAELSSVF